MAGNVLSDLGERVSGEQSAQYLEQAVAAYRAALEVKTRELLPQDWARTQNNLGTVLSELGIRLGGQQGAQYLEQSVTAIENALSIFTLKAAPQIVLRVRISKKRGQPPQDLLALK